MIIFPAIDIKDGVCVRLVQGKAEERTVYAHDPVEIALSWQRQGAEWLHVVDLDGAFTGQPLNRELIKRMAARISIPMQLGGGIRDISVVHEYLNMGVSRIIIGTKAQADRGFMQNLLDEFGEERVVVGIDARDGLVAVKGWEDITATAAVDLGRQMAEMGLVRTIYTDIRRDGMLQGPNFQGIEEMAAASGLKVIASGGISSPQDIRRLRRIPGVEGAILGKALYEGKIKLDEALVASRN